MSDNQLSRRQVLGALATTGGAGAIVGTGTGALFSDEETFTDNGIRASSSVAGVVDIDIDYDVISDGTGVVYDVTLPDGVNNNPSYIWFRADCPTEEEVDLACATNITVEVECDGETVTVASGSVRDVFNALRNGTLLCGGDAACLEIGETQTLEIKITGVDDWYDGDTKTLTFDLEFYGEQCRYDTGAENPFDDRETCEPCVQGVSWIAFCAEGPEAEAPMPKGSTELIESGTAVDWETENDVDYVAVKTGLGGQNEPYIVYDYRDEEKTSGIARVGDENADFRGDRDANGEFDGCDGGGPPDSCPCQYAKDILIDGDNDDFTGKSVKLEEVDGELEEE